MITERDEYAVIAYCYRDEWYTPEEVYAARHGSQQGMWKANPYTLAGLRHRWDNGRDIPEWVIEMVTGRAA